LIAKKSLLNPQLMVNKIEEASIIWGMLKKVLEKYLSAHNGVFATQVIHLIFLFLESPIFQDGVFNSLSILKLVKNQMSEIEKSILR
jgi:DNA-binding protein Fis